METLNNLGELLNNHNYCDCSKQFMDIWNNTFFVNYDMDKEEKKIMCNFILCLQCNSKKRLSSIDIIEVYLYTILRSVPKLEMYHVQWMITIARIRVERILANYPCKYHNTNKKTVVNMLETFMTCDVVNDNGYLKNNLMMCNEVLSMNDQKKATLTYFTFFESFVTSPEKNVVLMPLKKSKL